MTSDLLARLGRDGDRQVEKHEWLAYHLVEFGYVTEEEVLRLSIRFTRRDPTCTILLHTSRTWRSNAGDP